MRDDVHIGKGQTSIANLVVSVAKLNLESLYENRG